MHAHIKSYMYITVSLCLLFDNIAVADAFRHRRRSSIVSCVFGPPMQAIVVYARMYGCVRSAIFDNTCAHRGGERECNQTKRHTCHCSVICRVFTNKQTHTYNTTKTHTITPGSQLMESTVKISVTIVR